MEQKENMNATEAQEAGKPSTEFSLEDKSVEQVDLSEIRKDDKPDVADYRWSPSGSKWKDYMHFCGPGWFVAIAYVDPGNYQADINAGATAGYNLLWTLWWATCLSIYVQVLCARLAILGQVTLAEVQQQNFPKWFRIISWIIAEFSVIITDLPEVIGIGIAFNLFFGWPYYVGVLISPITTFIFLATQRLEGGMRWMECIIVFLVGIMSISLWVEMGIVGPDGKELVEGWIYGFAKPGGLETFNILGIIGAVVMPHNLYLHTALVLSRPVQRSAVVVKKAIFWSSIEPILPIFVSFTINMAIVTIAAESVYGEPNADTVGNTDFSNYLSFEAGPILWGIALLAAGQSSAVTTTYSGQYVMEGFLRVQLPVWQRAILTRAVALVPCVVIASVAQGEALNIMVNMVNAALSILLPFALTPLVKFSTSKAYLGENCPGKVQCTLLWFSAFLVYATNAYGLSAPNGGLFGSLMNGEVIELPTNMFVSNMTIVNQTQFSVQMNIINDVFQVLYFAWNVYVVITPIKAPMRKISDERDVKKEACFGVVNVIQ